MAAVREREKRKAEALVDAAANESISFEERATPALKLPRHTADAAAADGEGGADPVFVKKRAASGNMRQRPGKKPGAA